MDIINILMHFNWVDILILILLFIICYVSFNRGLGSELLPLIGNFTAIIIALHYYERIGGFIASHTPLKERQSEFIIFTLFAVIILVLFRLIDSLIIGKIVTVHVVSSFDKIGGLIVGIIRAVLLISLVLIALELTGVEYIDYSINEKSLTGKAFLKSGKFLHKKASAFLKIETKR